MKQSHSTFWLDGANGKKSFEIVDDSRWSRFQVQYYKDYIIRDTTQRDWLNVAFNQILLRLEMKGVELSIFFTSSIMSRYLRYHES